MCRLSDSIDSLWLFVEQGDGAPHIRPCYNPSHLTSPNTRSALITSTWVICGVRLSLICDIPIVIRYQHLVDGWFQYAIRLNCICRDIPVCDVVRGFVWTESAEPFEYVMKFRFDCIGNAVRVRDIIRYKFRSDCICRTIPICDVVRGFSRIETAEPFGYVT